MDGTVESTSDILFSELIDLEKNLELAFQTGRTPLILDTSSDDKICTFYSYQIDAIILEAKALILEGSRQTLVQVLEKARRCIVNAMKFGKLLVIRLGTSSPDFREKFNDDYLRLCDPTIDSHISYFPKETFYSGGSALHSEDWVKKLFREEDMKPHKNFAICRETFRVCVASQTPLGSIDEYLFGKTEENFGGLPSKSLFKIISIVDDESANKSHIDDESET
eukprot:gene22864-31165_t